MERSRILQLQSMHSVSIRMPTHLNRPAVQDMSAGIDTCDRSRLRPG